MLDEDVFLRVLWRVAKWLLEGVLTTIQFCSPARIIRKSITRTDFFDDDRPLYIQLFWIGIDVLSWGVLLFFIVRLLGR